MFNIPDCLERDDAPKRGCLFLMGGEIEMRSSEEEGTIITFCLKQKHADTVETCVSIMGDVEEGDHQIVS